MSLEMSQERRASTTNKGMGTIRTTRETQQAIMTKKRTTWDYTTIKETQEIQMSRRQEK